MTRRIRFIRLVLGCGIDWRGDQSADILIRQVGDRNCHRLKPRQTGAGNLHYRFSRLYPGIKGSDS